MIFWALWPKELTKILSGRGAACKSLVREYSDLVSFAFIPAPWTYHEIFRTLSPKTFHENPSNVVSWIYHFKLIAVNSHENMSDIS